MNTAASPTSSSENQPVRTIAYLGMGIMGAPMAGNLLQGGYDLTVWNRTASKCEPLTKEGAGAADSPAAAAGGKPDVIFINVTDTPDVEQVLFGESGVMEGASEGLIVVDNSTISPGATQDFAHRLADRGVTLLDAPVSGGDVGAKNGQLSIMVGGDEQAFTRCKPLLDLLGKSVVHLGPAGTGQACKACNQIAVAGNLLATCEALALAKQTGLDLDQMIEVVGGGAGGSWQLTNLGPKIARGDHDPGFMVDLILKDLAIVLETAREHNLPLNGTAVANGGFQSVAAHGEGDRGTQALARAMERLGNFQYTR